LFHSRTLFYQMIVVPVKRCSSAGTLFGAMRDAEPRGPTEPSAQAGERAPEPPWLRSRARPATGARAPLSRDAIVEAALRVLDRDGLDGVSMRRVATQLGTGAGSLYWHVANKDELLGLVFDRVAGDVELPPPDPQRWQEQYKQVAREARRVLKAHRDIARWSLGRIPMGPSTLRIGEWQLALLRAAGVPDLVAALAGDLFGLYVGAHAFEETLGLASPTGEELSPGETIAMIRGYLASLPPARFPNTVELVDQLMASDSDERFEFGLDVIVRGLAAHAG
jgi:AcrR family transcriptional regulator